MLLSRISSMLCVATMVLGPAMAYGQDPATGSGQAFPTRPIRIITSLPGGGSDFGARLIAQEISAPLGQPVIVENRPSNLTGESAMKALPDGYTLLVEGNSFYFAPLLQKTPYDVLRDFSPVTIGMIAPNIIVVHPSVPVNSIPELIALAKAKPGTLNFASGGTGATTHLAAELLKYMAGINMVHVPYKGTGPAVTGVVAGEVQLMSASAASVVAFTKSGKLRALAVTSAQPSALLPGLPTVASFGLPGYDLVNRTGVFASGKPSKAAINRLNQEIVRAVNSPDIKAKFFAAGVEVNTDTPEESVATIKTEVARMAKVVKATGMKIN